MSDPDISSPLQLLLVLAVASVVYFAVEMWERRR
jgi:hypothetical protein